MSSQDISECEKDDIEDHSVGENHLGNHALSKETSLPELKHVTSNVLSRITSRISTRDNFEPQPPPDGGLKAWTQVAAGCVTCFAAWYVHLLSSLVQDRR